jgi:hypothetical protein
MTTFERKYSVDEKEAVIYAYLDRRIRPLRAIVDLAARGELVTRDGRQVRPFDLNPNTVKSWLQVAKRKRQGTIRGAAFENPEGTIEALRKRLIALADSEIAYLERKRRGNVDPEHMRQIARAVREAAAIPVNGQPRGRKPGEVDENGHQPDQHTRGGMAGALLKAHRSKPAPGPPSPKQPHTENTHASSTTVQTQEKHDESGSLNSDSQTPRETHHASV